MIFVYSCLVLSGFSLGYVYGRIRERMIADSELRESLQKRGRIFE